MTKSTKTTYPTKKTGIAALSAIAAIVASSNVNAATVVADFDTPVLNSSVNVTGHF